MSNSGDRWNYDIPAPIGGVPSGTKPSANRPPARRPSVNKLHARRPSAKRPYVSAPAAKRPVSKSPAYYGVSPEDAAVIAAIRRRKAAERRARKRRLSITIIVCGLLNIAIIIGLISMGVSHYRADSQKGDRQSGISKIFTRERVSDNKTSKGFTIEVKDGVTYVDGIIIANKTYSLPEDYGDGLTEETQAAFNDMQAAAAADGISLSIASGFRSYDTQKSLFEQYSATYGVDEAETFSARPGHSEHQIGEAMDINDVSQAFADTPAYAWLQEHAYEYGFVMRYLKDKTDVTGYMYEPWHYRYVGKELAGKLYNGGDWITVEEYFGIDSKYSEEE